MAEIYRLLKMAHMRKQAEDYTGDGASDEGGEVAPTQAGDDRFARIKARRAQMLAAGRKQTSGPRRDPAPLTDSERTIARGGDPGVLPSAQQQLDQDRQTGRTQAALAAGGQMVSDAGPMPGPQFGADPDMQIRAQGGDPGILGSPNQQAYSAGLLDRTQAALAAGGQMRVGGGPMPGPQYYASGGLDPYSAPSPRDLAAAYAQPQAAPQSLARAGGGMDPGPLGPAPAGPVQGAVGWLRPRTPEQAEAGVAGFAQPAQGGPPGTLIAGQGGIPGQGGLVPSGAVPPGAAGGAPADAQARYEGSHPTVPYYPKGTPAMNPYLPDPAEGQGPDPRGVGPLAGMYGSQAHQSELLAPSGDTPIPRGGFLSGEKPVGDRPVFQAVPEQSVGQSMWRAPEGAQSVHQKTSDRDRLADMLSKKTVGPMVQGETEPSPQRGGRGATLGAGAEKPGAATPKKATSGRKWRPKTREEKAAGQKASLKDNAALAKKRGLSSPQQQQQQARPQQAQQQRQAGSGQNKPLGSGGLMNQLAAAKNRQPGASMNQRMAMNGQPAQPNRQVATAQRPANRPAAPQNQQTANQPTGTPPAQQLAVSRNQGAQPSNPMASRQAANQPTANNARGAAPRPAAPPAAAPAPPAIAGAGKVPGAPGGAPGGAKMKAPAPPSPTSAPPKQAGKPSRPAKPTV